MGGYLIIDNICIFANIEYMKKQTKQEFPKLALLDGEFAIKSSSKMSGFCKDTAYGIANFYKEEMYPLTEVELKPFIKQIKKEFKKIFDPKN